MRRYLVLILQLLVLVALSSCFGGGGGDEPDHPPAIANLQYSPAALTQSTGAKASIAVLADFTDAGSDVASAHMTSTSGDETTVPLSGLTGSAKGTVSTPFVVSVDKAGTFAFEVWLVDLRGSVSKRLSGAYEVLPAGQASTWAAVSVTPAAELLGIGWGGGPYVAVGRLGTVMTSPDLIAWTVQSSGVSHTLRSVAVSGSRIVAVGDNATGEALVISSPDGATWATQYNAGNCQGSACASPTQLSRVIWTGTQFVVVGMEQPLGSAMVYALVLTSPDGITWTQRAPRAMPISDEWTHPNQRWVTSVAWSGSLLVMPSIDANWESVVWTSPDAVTWTLSRDVTNEAVWPGPFIDVTWGNGRFVALDGPASNGDSPVITSVDGLRWLPDTTAANLPLMNAITARPGEFVAVGATHLQTSPDGLNWTVHPLAGCGNAVLWDGTRYVAVGNSICKSP